MTDEIPPERILARVRDAQQRFAAAIEGLTDADVSAPSLLPGWTAGHVLAHVARNADSHVRRAEAAAHGEVVDQYPGGLAGRAKEIEDGAQRGADALQVDVTTSAERLDAAWRATPAAAWLGITRDVGGRERPLHHLTWRRWQELEVHVVDLNLGVSHRDWPAEFVVEWLPQLRAGAAERLPARASVPSAAFRDDHDELAWLYGRLDRPDLPPLQPWN